ncbi:MAG: transglycosylase SLT domain-containing protein, partial [Deltaproteobacteria bacterium]|nr:transglycosylase SLT domain-containing protein [Deltaproteobacteria bacterium]
VDPDNEIDERLSPIKSTAAAAKMFKRNYRLLHDWGLAIIAYNHGPKNLVPLRDQYGGKNIAKLLQKTAHTPLGYASRSYYSEFLALLHAERYRDEIYGLPTHVHPDAISIVKIKKPASVFEIAALYNISIHELKMFNPDIFNLRRKLPAGTRVVLPRKHGESIVVAPQLDPSHPGPTGTGDPSGRGIASEEEFIEYIK